MPADVRGHMLTPDNVYNMIESKSITSNNITNGP
jgi:hypothetical protein